MVGKIQANGMLLGEKSKQQRGQRQWSWSRAYGDLHRFVGHLEYSIVVIKLYVSTTMGGFELKEK